MSSTRNIIQSINQAITKQLMTDNHLYWDVKWLVYIKFEEEEGRGVSTYTWQKQGRV